MEGTVKVSKTEQFKWRIIEDFRGGRIGRRQAAELLCVTEKTIQRLAKRCRESGLLGLKHGNLGRKPSNALSEDLKAKVLKLASQSYYDFNMVHCLEMLKERHQIDLSYSVFRRWCREAGIGKRKRRRSSKARLYRERFGNEGLLLQMDGSHHKWNGQDDWVLIGAIDDATSNIPHCEFFRSEDTLNCMTVVRRIIELKGIPEAFYVDRAGWFGGMKRQHFSQFVRACDELDIRVIYANSPQAKGRIERTWRTFQDRLIPELRVLGIKALEEANKYLQQQFIPNYWQMQNTVEARNLQSRYRRLAVGENLDQIFCMKFSRQIGRSHTFGFNREQYRITGGIVGSLAGKEITLIERETGALEAYYGHLRLEFKPIVQMGRSNVRVLPKKRKA